MTRKRFVKLLMAKGFSRNRANELAEAARLSGRSYAEVYKVGPIAVEVLINNLAKSLGPAIRAMSESLGRMVTAIGKGVAAFCEAYDAAMAGIQKLEDSAQPEEAAQ